MKSRNLLVLVTPLHHVFRPKMSAKVFFCNLKRCEPMFINKQDTFYGTPCSSASTWISVSTSFSCHFRLTGLFFRNHSRLDRVPKGELETPAIHTIFRNSLCFNGHFFSK